MPRKVPQCGGRETAKFAALASGGFVHKVVFDAQFRRRLAAKGCFVPLSGPWPNFSERLLRGTEQTLDIQTLAEQPLWATRILFAGKTITAEPKQV